MTNSGALRCDGCGQAALAGHIARRLQRLEWTTQYRPIHIGTLLLGGAAPTAASDFLYAPIGEFAGEAALVLDAAGIGSSGKSREVVLAEFQRGGFFLAHALECPFEGVQIDPAERQSLVESRLPAALARIRRSLKPKRVAPISKLWEPMLERLNPGELGCAIVLDSGRPFALDGDQPREALQHLREALAGAIPARSGSS
jgi:hypothetical protein